MSLNGKQSLMTLTLTLDYAAAKKLEIDLEELTPRLQKATHSLLTTIHPDVIMVDVMRSAGYITSFTNGKNLSQIEAVFQGYENQQKEPLNITTFEERDKKAHELVEKKRLQLRDNPLTAEFPKEGIPEGVLLGMKFVVTGIDYRYNVITFSLIE